MNAFVLIVLFSSGYVKSVQNVGTFQTLQACQAAETWVRAEVQAAWDPGVLKTQCVPTKAGAR